MEIKNFVHKKANLEGQVKLGRNSSVWPFASIRGDEGEIVIGDNSNIQDSAVIHGAVVIGDNVTVGHGAIIHNAIIGSNVVVGINSVILDGVQIDDWNIIAAGSIVTPNTKIDQENIVMGIPAKITRKLNQEDKNFIIEAYQNYLKKLILITKI